MNDIIGKCIETKQHLICERCQGRGEVRPDGYSWCCPDCGGTGKANNNIIKKCINCAKNPQTRSDLMCDECRREDYKHRQMTVGGYVLFWENLPFGWTRDLSRPHENRPGVIAVGDGDQHIAFGGDEQNGAVEWIYIKNL